MIEPAQFLRAMGHPEAEVLRTNASAIILEYLGRMNYPVEALFNMPIAALQVGPIVVGGATGSVRMRINVEGDVSKPVVQEVRGGRILTANAQGAYSIINERVVLTMTDAGDAVAVLIAAYSGAAVERVDAPMPNAFRRIRLSLRNLLWQLLPSWLRRGPQDR